MKTRKKELDVDFIGGSGPLTKEEEKRMSRSEIGLHEITCKRYEKIR